MRGLHARGASSLPYAGPNLSGELHPTNVGVPVLWWRSVGSTHTAFSRATFLAELAHATGRDPLEVRRALLAEAGKVVQHARYLTRDGTVPQGNGLAGPAGLVEAVPWCENA